MAIDSVAGRHSAAIPQHVREHDVSGAVLACMVAVIAVAGVLLALVVIWRRQQRQIVALRQQLAQRFGAERAQAAAEERQRLLADLHDDIGAKLLTLIHALDNREHADLARAVVQDFRDVVSRTHQDACSLLQALGQIREETEQRLDALGSTLDWQQSAELPDPELDEAQVLHLFRIAREAITNALRHGHATHVRIRMLASGRNLLLDVTDNGPGFSPEPLQPGRGTSSMRNRAQELHGTIDWRPGTLGGTKVVLEFPLP